MMLTADPLRLAGALVLSFAWLGASVGLLRRRALPAAAAGADWLVIHASQTGTAAELAEQTSAALERAGVSARATCISTLDAATLASASHALFIASTCGEGDAPDRAAGFASKVMATQPDLSHLRHAVLALGDREFRQFCGFGRALDDWLASCGSTPLFDRIEADRVAQHAVDQWFTQLGTSQQAEAPADWQIAGRTLLNPGSSGEPLYRIRLLPAVGALPEWQAGDIAQVFPPAEPGRPRDYSIASVPSEGQLDLMVRLRRSADGVPGVASGWLCNAACEGDIVRVRIRAHEAFRMGANGTRPLIAIGNGSGLAGLRSLLRGRIDAGNSDNWLLFGERQRRHDFLCREELQEWLAGGQLARLDLAFSRDPEACYVQHLLLAHSHALSEWLARGAAIYVCGSREGMGAGVHDALQAIVGSDALALLSEQGRYRRDLY